MLRSLIEDFHTKVIVIEDQEDLNTLNLKKLVENLQTFKDDLRQSSDTLKITKI